MRIVLISLTLILLNFQSFCQDKFLFDWNGKSFIDTLKSNGVDTVCTIKSYCVGCKIKWDNEAEVCENKDWRYFNLLVFWKHSGINYYKKFNNCFEYETKQLDSIGFLDYFIDNRAVISKEKIKSAVGIEVINGDTSLIIYDVDLYNKLDITMEIHGDKYQNEFYDYNFDTSFNKLYGRRNVQLRLFALYRMIYKEYADIERRYKPKIVK